MAKKDIVSKETTLEAAVKSRIESTEGKEMIDELVAKHAETTARREKKVALDGSEESVFKASESKKLDDTVAFFKAAKSGDMQTLQKLSDVTAKALNTGTGSAGGYLVPVEFERMVMKKLESYSQIRQNARTVRMNAQTMRLNDLITEPVVSIVGEGTEIPETENVYAEPILTARKYAAFQTWTNELEADSEVSIVSELADDFARAIAKKEQDEFMNSATSGSEGLLAAAGVTVIDIAGTTSLGTTYDDLNNLIKASREYSIDEDNMAKYFMSPGVWSAVEQSKAAGGSGTYFGGNPVNGWTESAWGKEVVLLNEAPTPVIADTKFAVYGDLKRHLVIGDRAGLAVRIFETGTAGTDNLLTEDKKTMRVVKRTANVTRLNAGIFVLSTGSA